MNLFETIIMGIIQGVAEFLPISSSGHLCFGKYVLGLNTEVDMLYDVMLHIGTLIAVFIAFWEDIKELIIEGIGIVRDIFINLFIAVSSFFSRNSKENSENIDNDILQTSSNKKSVDEDEQIKHAQEQVHNNELNVKYNSHNKSYRKILGTPYRRFVALIIVSTIPTGIMGVCFGDLIDKASETVLIPGICLLMTGVLLRIADITKPGTLDAQTTPYKKAGLVGIAQGFATLPGLSRSGTTITACLLCGFNKAYAVKYSFIMSIPAILGAAVLEIADFDDTINSDLILNYLVGTVVAGVVGYVCIKTMLKIVKDKKFIGFSIYCFVVGAIAIAYHFIH
ncbi:MAG: undecaprenyl-diphosphate phosphatase [Lachnospiraceae bacterium]|nr:undecaprenyl-diphosphate phosphatase [Lachnospiraceae bacterium]